MKRRLLGKNTALALTLLMAGLAGVPAAAQSGATEGIKQIYGITADPGNPNTVLIGTDYGLLRSTSDGISTIIPGVEASVVGLVAAPGNPRELYLSGTARDGQPTGVMVSRDGGASWSPLALDASAGKLLFRGLSISLKNPNRMAALDEKIVLSNDQGASWASLDSTPEKTLAVALSSIDDHRLYAATMTGLMVSTDDGASWTRTYDTEAPATMIAGLISGRMVAFIYGVGLITANEADLSWTILSDGFEDRYLLALTQDPENSDLLYATADTGAILLSRDGGQLWSSFEGSQQSTPARIAQGQQLFTDNCQVCHGAKGIGEAPGNPTAKDDFGFMAPALNDDMHAWHHGDANLHATISTGSPRNERMIAWKEQLSDAEIDDIIAYIKSLWSVRSLACQGARHMGCING